MPKLKTDFVKLINACVNKNLNSINLEWHNDKSLCIVLCSKGYPESYENNIEIQNYHGLGLEFELAMEISSDLDESIGKLNENNVKNYISNIYTAFELIIDRNADYSKINALTMTADNVWCGGVVLGNKINNWENLDFNTLQSTLLWNDEAPQKAFIKDATPFRTLAWVINVRLSQNINIPSGSKIITGSVIKTRAPKKGDHIIYKIDRLSQVEVKII